MYECIREVFQKKYVASDGRIGSGSQTSYLLSFFVGLIPDDLIEKSIAHLVENIHAAGDNVQVGFLGVRHICPILSQFGHSDLAYKLATSTDFPSWGYSVVNGATTIWERWDGWTKEHGFQIPNMNSFNHYAYGSIGEWLFEWMGGIALVPNVPAYKHFFRRPTISSNMTYCNVSFDSPSGTIVSNWAQTNDGTHYHFEVPANSCATVQLEAEQNRQIYVNDKRTKAIFTTLYRTKRAIFDIGSGVYEVWV